MKVSNEQRESSNIAKKVQPFDLSAHGMIPIGTLYE